MSENKTHGAGYNQGGIVRPFVREWAEAIRANPDKIVLESFLATNEKDECYKQIFAPAGMQQPYAYSRSIWRHLCCTTFVAYIVSAFEEKGERVNVSFINEDEKSTLVEAFKYWHPTLVSQRHEKEEKTKRDTEVIRLAKLPAFTP